MRINIVRCAAGRAVNPQKVMTVAKVAERVRGAQPRANAAASLPVCARESCGGTPIAANQINLQISLLPSPQMMHALGRAPNPSKQAVQAE
jgi:hypothetical protein